MSHTRPDDYEDQRGGPGRRSPLLDEPDMRRGVVDSHQRQHNNNDSGGSSSRRNRRNQQADDDDRDGAHTPAGLRRGTPAGGWPSTDPYDPGRADRRQRQQNIKDAQNQRGRASNLNSGGRRHGYESPSRQSPNSRRHTSLHADDAEEPPPSRHSPRYHDEEPEEEYDDRREPNPPRIADEIIEQGYADADEITEMGTFEINSDDDDDSRDETSAPSASTNRGSNGNRRPSDPAVFNERTHSVLHGVTDAARRDPRSFSPTLPGAPIAATQRQAGPRKPGDYNHDLADMLSEDEEVSDDDIHYKSPLRGGGSTQGGYGPNSAMPASCAGAGLREGRDDYRRRPSNDEYGAPYNEASPVGCCHRSAAAQGTGYDDLPRGRQPEADGDMPWLAALPDGGSEDPSEARQRPRQAREYDEHSAGGSGGYGSYGSGYDGGASREEDYATHREEYGDYAPEPAPRSSGRRQRRMQQHAANGDSYHHEREEEPTETAPQQPSRNDWDDDEEEEEALSRPQRRANPPPQNDLAPPPRRAGGLAARARAMRQE